MNKKIISAFLSVIIALGGMLMFTSCTKQTQLFSLRFITTPVCADAKVSSFEYTLSWDTDTFTLPPQKLNEDLARTALVLSSTAYDCTTALDNLVAMGFEHKAKFNYGDNYEQNAVGVIIASRQIADMTLVAITLRGTYNREWFSNFDIGQDISQTKVHHGFNNASEFTLSKLHMYLSNYGIDKDNMKLLVTGHSRGAAVANLTAKSLIDTYGADNVYAYTFATPNTTTDENATDTRYSGIFNFVNDEDFICHIPLSSWGFTKYGTTITLNSSANEHLDEIKNLYMQYRNRELKTYGSTDSLNNFVDHASKLAPTVNDYYSAKYEIAGLSMSLYEYMNIVAEILNEENLLSNGLLIMSSDNTAFAPIRDYILSGIDMNSLSLDIDYNSALLSYSHPAETYLCLLETYMKYM